MSAKLQRTCTVSLPHLPVESGRRKHRTPGVFRPFAVWTGRDNGTGATSPTARRRSRIPGEAELVCFVCRGVLTLMGPKTDQVQAQNTFGCGRRATEAAHFGTLTLGLQVLPQKVGLGWAWSVQSYLLPQVRLEPQGEGVSWGGRPFQFPKRLTIGHPVAMK